MRTVKLYTKEGCHLCEEALAVIARYEEPDVPALVRAADYGDRRMEAIPEQAVRDALEGLLAP